MINVKLEKLIAAIPTLDKLGNIPLKGKLAYKLGKTIQVISNELQLYEKARQDMLEKFCVKDENGQLIVDNNGNVQIEKQYIGEYNTEIQKMNEIEIELNIIPWDLDDFANIELTPKEIVDIEWAIKKEEG